MGALTEEDQRLLEDAEEYLDCGTQDGLAALVRRLAGRVEETGAALFRAENDISNALCSLRANDHQTREILEAARTRIWVARGIELPDTTAPREAADGAATKPTAFGLCAVCGFTSCRCLIALTQEQQALIADYEHTDRYAGEVDELIAIIRALAARDAKEGEK